MSSKLLAKKPPPPVFTIEECTKCGLKMKRPFKEGDYVYKVSGECSKCKGPLMITLIYAESVKPS